MIVSNSAKQILEVMRQDNDPRMQNSKFLSFMEKLRDGHLKIQDNEIVKGDAILQSNWFWIELYKHLSVPTYL